MFKKFFGFGFFNEDNEKPSDDDSIQGQQNGNGSSSTQSRGQASGITTTYSSQSQRQIDNETSTGNGSSGLQSRRRLSIQEMQKVMIYESSFSDFLIMLDSGQEIKTLSNAEWSDIIKAKSIEGVSNERIQFSLLKGIPFDIRKDVWLILSNVSKLKQDNPQFNYSEKCRKEGPSDSIILKDLNRTFTEIPFFSDFDKQDQKYQGREKLLRVLRAYSHYDKEIGYTQGMNFIAGSLLLLMNPDNEKELQEITIIDKEYEENIFWILVHIMDEKKWRVLFKDGTPGIYVVMRKLEEKMKENIPEIYNHIIDIGLDCFSCFSQYFFTIMLYNAPKTVQKRILDLFLFEGEEVLYSIIIKMLTLCEDQILRKFDMQEMMEFCRKGILEECHRIFKEEKLKGDIDFSDFKFNIAKLHQFDLLSSK